MIKIDLNQSYSKSYIKGHVNPFWTTDDYANLPYVKQEITLEEELSQWYSYGYPKSNSFSGMMYSSKNVMPEFTERFKTMFSNVKNMTFTIYKMETLDIMPVHVDHFSTYKKIFNVESENVIRILVMLEDWKPGHYLEMNGEGVVNWKAGDYFIWEQNVPHAASNIGKITDPRYTLQITATVIDDNSHLYESNKLYEFNIPDRGWINDSHTVTRIQNTISNNNGLPYIVYTGNERIKELEEIKYLECTSNELNNLGLDIYLYEPLCSYIEGQTTLPKGTKHTEWFYSEFKNNIDYNSLRADELDSILKFKRNNNLDTVRVHTCDYDVAKYYPYYANELTLMTDDIFIRSCLYKKILDRDFRSVKLTKKFISLNYRYTFHRHLIASYLANLDSRLTWVFKCDYEHMKKSVWHDLSNSKWDNHRSSILEGTNTLNQNSPYVLDFEFSHSTEINHHYFKPRFPEHKNITTLDWFAIEKHYKDVFVDIVTESRFAQPTANYSEKVQQAMLYFKPFVLVAPPYTLKYLHEHGFKTFNEFWDESYDTTENHDERMIKILDVIKKISDMSIEECNDMYQKMLPILEHNQKLLRITLRP
jgi:hypothetical protein